MQRIKGLKTAPKLLIIFIIIALLISVVFLNIQKSGGGTNALNEAVEGGEYALTAVGRSYESFQYFAQLDQQQAEEVLKAARSAIDNAKVKLNSAMRTGDEFALRRVENYQKISGASEVMAQGVDNLLTVSDNVQSAIAYLSQGMLEEAGQQASQCLDFLTPLQNDFDYWNNSLNEVNYHYIASGHRDRVDYAIQQYRFEHQAYAEFILLLKTLLEGKEYLEKSDLIDEKLMQLQSAIANKDYQTAQNLIQEISDLLQELKDPRFQNAMASASQLNPNLLEGEAYDAANELKTKIKDAAGIEAYENYLKSLQKFIEASDYLEQENLDAAQQAANEGAGILGQGQALTNPELQRLYTGLSEAFNSLNMRIRGQPDQG
jgi:hypothetical protein